MIFRPRRDLTALGACLLAAACGASDRAGGSTRPTTGPLCHGVDLFLAQCTGGVCHAGPKAARGLDLRSADPAPRLVGVASTCAGRLLIDPSDPSKSFLLEKISSAAPACGGGRMPLSGQPLPLDVLTCVKEWVTAVTP